MDKKRFDWIISGLDFNDLTPWEEKFLEDMEYKMECHGDINPWQEEKIEQIYREKSR
jgi:hypothetical protein